MPKIEAVDLFYLSMPTIALEGDGSQDALLVRVAAGGDVGWGECEASPLVSMAAFVCPPSHSACRPVSASVLGQRLDTPDDIARIAATVAYDSMDLLQAPHTWSGIEMALWDVLGRWRGAPVWSMLGYTQACRKQPYASRLFGNTPEQTFAAARATRDAGFQAVKFGWGPIGRKTVQDDLDQFRAAREGLGPDGLLMVDAAQIWNDDVSAARLRTAALEAVEAAWLEEPFRAGAYKAYHDLARSTSVRLAGGEAAHNVDMAQNLIDFGGIGFVQIDCGRVGGIGPAKLIADYAAARNVTYVNHTFTSHLALSASLQPYAGLADHRLCEYPVALKPLAYELTNEHITLDVDGLISIPDRPGLGMSINPETLERYKVEVEIRVNGAVLLPQVNP